jgi:hypothetical protein
MSCEAPRQSSRSLRLLGNREWTNGHPVILGRATDDFLCACESVATYDYIVTQFRNRWKIHSLGVIRTFFGLNFVIPDHCITTNQTGVSPLCSPITYNNKKRFILTEK